MSCGWCLCFVVSNHPGRTPTSAPAINKNLSRSLVCILCSGSETQTRTNFHGLGHELWRETERGDVDDTFWAYKERKSVSVVVFVLLLVATTSRSIKY